MSNNQQQLIQRQGQQVANSGAGGSQSSGQIQQSNQPQSQNQGQSSQQQAGQQQGQQQQAGDASGSAGASSVDPHFARLQDASRTLSKRLDLDRKIEQACGLTDILGSGGPASGDYIDPHIEAWAPFRKQRTINLPDELFEKYDLVQSHFNMGLLPEIDRAWLTIDNKLFLWDYKDGSGFTSFEEIQEVILAVAFVKPKPGIFIDGITHLLVLSTSAAVHLIGMSPVPAQRRQPGQPPFALYVLDLAVPTGEGRALSSICATRSGRIFGCSTRSPGGAANVSGSGELYELVYNAKEGLFSKRAYFVNLSSGGGVSGSWLLPSFVKGEGNTDPIEQIVLDQERDLLYTRSQKNVLELWNVQQGKAEKVATLRDLHRLAGSFCQGHPLFHGPNAPPLNIVNMDVVNVADGKMVGLVAIASTGVRLYISYHRGGLRTYNAQSPVPTGLELVHVRLPPQLPRDIPPIDITRAIVPSTGGGFFLAASPVNEDDDMLLLHAPDIGRLAQAAIQGTRSSFIEYACRLRVEGRAWAVAESNASSAPGLTTQRNELASQASTRVQREWLFLTNMGMHIIVRQRPIDTLYALLADSAAGGAAARDGSLNAFASAYGQDQTCAMLLALLAESSAFGAAGTTLSTELAFAARQAYTNLDIGGRPTAVQRGLPVSQAVQTVADGKVVLSARHEGLAWYLARLMQPLVDRKIVSQVPGPQRLVSTVPDQRLLAVQRDLSSLRNFLDSQPQLFAMVGDQYSGPDAMMAYNEEQRSVHNLRLLLTQTIEAISFVLLLIDYKLAEVMSACPQEVASAVLEMTWTDLLASSKGKEVARNLVNAVINIQLGQNLSIDAISDVLQQRCGSFCSADDVLLYKAIENIRKAKSGPPAERTSNLRESLRLFSKAAAHLGSSKLAEIISEFNSLHFQIGSVELALACAASWDPEERGLSWWKDGRPAHDSRAPSWEPRSFCYDKAVEALSSADDLLNLSVQDSAKTPITQTEATTIRTNAYNRALSSQDEAFHFRLYEWHLQKGLSDQLLGIRSPYVELFLLQDPATLERYDLLWQYYARQLQHGKAASVLASLAESIEFQLSLEKRLEYLSLASSDSKSQFPNPATREDVIAFLTEVEEKIEVASVQIELLSRLESHSDEQQQRMAAEQLRSRLYNISELYSDFAQPFQLFDMMLLIYHISDYRDTEKVIETWTQLIEQIATERGEDTDAVLASTVTSLARRFYPSEVALPISIIIELLERFALDQAQGKPAQISQERAWIPLALHEGGIPWEIIFEAYNEIIELGQNPWQDRSNMSHLLASSVTILSSWLQETSTAGSGSGRGRFPANEISRAIDRFIDLSSANKEIRLRLQDLNRDVHVRF